MTDITFHNTNDIRKVEDFIEKTKRNYPNYENRKRNIIAGKLAEIAVYQKYINKAKDMHGPTYIVGQYDKGDLGPNYHVKSYVKSPNYKDSILLYPNQSGILFIAENFIEDDNMYSCIIRHVLPASIITPLLKDTYCKYPGNVKSKKAFYFDDLQNIDLTKIQQDTRLSFRFF